MSMVSIGSLWSAVAPGRGTFDLSLNSGALNSGALNSGPLANAHMPPVDEADAPEAEEVTLVDYARAKEWERLLEQRRKK